MPAPSWIYDGVESVLGVSGLNPALVSGPLVSDMVNRWGRYGTNAPRAAFKNLQLTYLDDTTGNNKLLLEAGNIQGACWYNAYPSSLQSYIVVSVAGTIFTILIRGNRGYVQKLFTGNDPVKTHCWFGQAFEWLIIQDGSSKPILWNGNDPARRAVTDEVPVGSVMAFIHGRLAVASADGTNQIAVGDIVYGSDKTTTNDVIRFTETQYWAEGGAFGAPYFLGEIQALIPMPYLDTGTGQNELVLLGTEAAASLDLSKPRDTWLNNSILRISQVGGGCVSSHSPVLWNGDLLYRSENGVRSYRNARSEFQRSWKQTPISTDVRRWLDYDNATLLQYSSQATWNNLLISTCAPRLAPANNPFAGHHRYHLGMVVLDAAPESNPGSEGASIWQGMWTGIRPVCFVQNSSQCFTFSYDCDGRNRLYEIQKGFSDTLEGAPVRIVSGFTTGSLGVIERVANNFTPKKLGGGSIELSDIRGPVDVEVKYRNDNGACFLPLDTFQAGCECEVKECSTTSNAPTMTLPRFARKHFSEPQDKCAPGMDQRADFLFHTQAKVKMEGWCVVDRLRLKFTRQEDAELKECGIGNCEPIQCCEDDFYCIANGPGPAVPVITTPSDVVTYCSDATVTARCPSGSRGGSVTVTRSACSVVSQADANAKAKAAATAAAGARLICNSCETETLAAFIANLNSTDLSAYFVPGVIDANRQWRLIELVSGFVYAQGYSSSDGELLVIGTATDGNGNFNAGTFIFTETAGIDADMALQVACNTDDSLVWPETGDYFAP